MSRYLGPQRCGEADHFYVKQQDITLLLVTTFLKELPLKRKKKICSWNKHHGKDIIIPFKNIISDGWEVAAIK